ncbi:MAG: phospholipase [Cytophagaceae bacterium SCN 52-12]|nr:MAG: phospholipase [Cytophagaceae bacterium SCN 52-12]
MPVSLIFFRKFRAPVLVLVFSALLFSCREGSDPLPREDRYLVKATAAGEISREQIVTAANSIIPGLGNVVQTGARLYRITYKTTNVDGSDIVASGAIVVPLGNQQYPMLSIQHGTIWDDASAPSNFSTGTEVTEFGSIFAALGYIAVFPDYIGYGASKDLPHPYEHRESLATACLDMLRAAKEFIANSNEYKWNNKLYISGFSEGGYATLSLQKMLEENAAGEFDLRASTCGAGAYNKTAFMNYLVNNQTHGIASYNRSYIWVVLSYNRIYNLNYPVSHFFKEPFASEIEKQQQKASLKGSFDDMLKEEFANGINNGSEKEFIAATADNDLLDWKPVTPTQLYHGTADELVFYFNSETAYQSMKAKGATQVELKKLEGKTHSTAVADYLVGTYSFFNSKP